MIRPNLDVHELKELLRLPATFLRSDEYGFFY